MVDLYWNCLTFIFRRLKSFDLFLADLHSVSFNVMDVFENVDDKLFAFETLFTEVLDDHAPLKQYHVRGNQVSYMTEEWRKAIRYRNRLWKSLQKTELTVIIIYTKHKEISSRL